MYNLVGLEYQQNVLCIALIGIPFWLWIGQVGIKWGREGDINVHDSVQQLAQKCAMVGFSFICVGQ